MAWSLWSVEMRNQIAETETDTDTDAERFMKTLCFWEQCDWWWKWERYKYGPSASKPMIGDRSLCEQCITRLMNGGGPPWNPNNSQRCEEWLRRMVLPGLPSPFMIPELASFLAAPFVP